MSEVDILKAKLDRALKAQHQAEQLLEEKSLELFELNQKLEHNVQDLRQEVDFHTRQLLNAQKLASLGTLLWDARAEHVTWSDEVSHILGLNPAEDELSMDVYLSAIHPEDREQISEYIAQALTEGLSLDRRYEIRHRIIRPSGEVRWVHGVSEALPNEHGDPVFLLGTVQDETEQVLLNQSLEAQQKELESAKEAAEIASEAKTYFLAMMSHEIRTPLNGVLGTLSLLQDQEMSDRAHKLVSSGLQSGENLRILLNDIVDLSKLEAGKIDLEVFSFSLEDLLGDIIAFWRPNVEAKGLTIELGQQVPLPPFLSSDPARIRQILNNYISNAIKFTKEGGIRVDLSLDEDVQSHRLILTVSDTGVGIEAEDTTKLFKNFSQIAQGDRSEIIGAGLGLAISKKLATVLDGEVGVESTPGQGSSFWLQIPLIAGASSADPRANSGLAAKHGVPLLTTASGKKPRILVAEDVPTNQMVTQLMLKDMGCRTDLVANGLEAVEAVCARPYDAVLMDVSMPEMDGTEAARRIRNLGYDDLPIIALTAFAMADDRKRILASGMTDFLPKPISRFKLSKMLQKTLEKEGRLPLLDEEIFQGFLENIDAGTAHVLFERFIQDVDDAGSALRGTKTLEACHRLKGVCGSFGAKALADEAAKLEARLKSEERHILSDEEWALISGLKTKTLQVARQSQDHLIGKAEAG